MDGVSTTCASLVPQVRDTERWPTLGHMLSEKKYITGKSFKGHPDSRGEANKAQAVLVSLPLIQDVTFPKRDRNKAWAVCGRSSLSQDTAFPSHSIIILRTPGKKKRGEKLGWPWLSRNH